MEAYRIGLLPRAAAEIKAIQTWWLQHRTSAPALFLNELSLAFKTIGGNPELGRKVSLRDYPNARTYVLRRTRYVIIYNIDSKQRLLAIARVRHGSRRPLARTKKKSP